MSHPEFNLPGIEGATKDALEEVLELGTALAKMLRFGPNSVNPLLPVEQQVTNFTWVLQECQDVVDKMQRLIALMSATGKDLQQFTPIQIGVN